MKSFDVRKRYIDFFIEKAHTLIPSSSLVPEDPTTLFTSAGMQPMLPYLLGKPYPKGRKVVNSQKCFRSQDIMEIGDGRHTTFFEMLGNWSFGDYWKEEQLSWLFEFLTDDLNLDPQRLYVTAFAGDAEISRDQETITIWQNLFQKKGMEAKIGERIFLYGVDKNWWSRFDEPKKMPEGEPGGPDSEVFYLFPNIPHNPKFGQTCHPNCGCGRFLEIANSVFMQYLKQPDGSFIELPQKNVDFGGGLERLTAAVNNSSDIFSIDLLLPIVKKISESQGIKYGSDKNIDSNFRVIADHIKASVFLIKDGVLPSNKMQGYVLRRLLRRSAVKMHVISQGETLQRLPELVDIVFEIYKDTNYFDISDGQKIKKIISEELERFQKTLKNGLKEIEKIPHADGKVAFYLYQSFGFPYEIIEEIFSEKGQTIDKKEFDKKFKIHQQLSKR